MSRTLRLQATSLVLVALAACCNGIAQAASAPDTNLPSFVILNQPSTAPAPASPSIPTLPSPVSEGEMRATSDPRAPTRPDADLAFGAFQRGYFATALNEAMKRVQRNPKDGAAMALIGEIYSQGLAVRPNPAEAAKWDRLASLEGNREAEFSYGMALLKGDGVPKDRAAASVQLEKAAAQGHAGALYNLGVIAVEGDKGRPRDFGLAAVFFQRAADAGDLDALDALAAMYKAGSGVPQDVAKAGGLLKQAADQKLPGAEVEYGIMLFNGEGVDKNEAEAAHYFLMGANQGNPVAADRLARLYAAGRGIARDPIEAARWHIMARAAGIPDAWLDQQLAALAPSDKAKVEELVRRQLGQ